MVCEFRGLGLPAKVSPGKASKGLAFPPHTVTHGMRKSHQMQRVACVHH